MSTTRRFLFTAGAGLTSAAIARAHAFEIEAAVGARREGDRDSSGDPDLEELVHHASEAHAALMAGDLGRYRASLTFSDDSTLMTPFGGKTTRIAELSNERWESIARFFRNGRDADLQLIESYRSADIAVLVAIERANVEVGGLPAQDWALRVTLVFRRDEQQWRLVHRHADPLVHGIRVETSAAMARGAAM